MLVINTLLNKRFSDYVDLDYLKNPEIKYIPIEDSEKLLNLISHRKYTPEHHQMLITINYNSNQIVGVDAPDGLDLWDTYIEAIETFLNEGKAEVMYGIDPYLLKFLPADDNLLSFSIEDEWAPVKVYSQALLPVEEFFEALLNGAEHFWNTLKDYRVFEEKEIRESTPKNYPELRIEQIQAIKKDIKSLWK